MIELIGAAILAILAAFVGGNWQGRRKERKRAEQERTQETLDTLILRDRIEAEVEGKDDEALVAALTRDAGA